MKTRDDLWNDHFTIDRHAWPFAIPGSDYQLVIVGLRALGSEEQDALQVKDMFLAHLVSMTALISVRFVELSAFAVQS
jgi:hypothetical protein